MKLSSRRAKTSKKCVIEKMQSSTETLTDKSEFLSKHQTVRKGKTLSYYYFETLRNWMGPLSILSKIGVPVKCTVGHLSQNYLERLRYSKRRANINF